MNFLKNIVTSTLIFASLPTCSQVIGYLPYWTGDTSTIPYSGLTHINYAFALPREDGSLKSLDDKDRLHSVVASAHAAGVKVSISVGGWSDNGVPLNSTFETIGQNPQYRSNLVNSIVSYVNEYNLDGVDVDWEFPVAGNNANNFSSLMSELHTSLDTNKLLTAAVGPDISHANGINTEVKDVVDWLNIMAYNFDGKDHSTFDDSVSAINLYKDKGFDNSQLVLGVPFYGHDENHQTSYSYSELLAKGANPDRDVFLDPDTGKEIGYNGVLTIEEKARYVRDNDLAGIMFWEMSQDVNGENSLIAAIDNQLTAVPLPPSIVMLLSGLGLLGGMKRLQTGQTKMADPA